MKRLCHMGNIILYISMLMHSPIRKKMSEVIQESCAKTSKDVPTFFIIIFRLLFSMHEQKIVFISKNKSVIDSWSSGSSPRADDLNNKRKNDTDSKNERLAGYATMKQQTTDMIFQIMVNARQKGHCQLKQLKSISLVGDVQIMVTNQWYEQVVR